MSEAIKFCKKLTEQAYERFDSQHIGVPQVVINEELQKRQFKKYRFWFDTQGYLFYNLHPVDFLLSTFEKIAKIVRQFEPNMHIQFSEFTGFDNEKGIEFTVKRQIVVLMHDRFLVRNLDGAILGESPPTEKLADLLVEFYWEYGNHKKKTIELDRAKSIHL